MATKNMQGPRARAHRNQEKIDAGYKAMNAPVKGIDDFARKAINNSDFEVATVRDCVAREWVDKLAVDILACERDSCVGNRIVGYLCAVDAVLRQTSEPNLRGVIAAHALRQCNVWYFG